MEFPEGLPKLRVDNYELLRPYFFTKTLHFSFGSDKGRFRENWQFAVEKMPADRMVEALEKFGFSGIIINRKGFEDGGKSLVKNLGLLGHGDVIEDHLKEQVCVLLRPSNQPQLPESGKYVQWEFDSNWVLSLYSPIATFRVAEGNAGVLINGSQKGNDHFLIRFEVNCPQATHLKVTHQRRLAWEGQLEAQKPVAIEIRIVGDPGLNLLGFESDQKPVLTIPSPGSEPVMISYIICNLEILKESAPDEASVVQ